MKFVGLDLSLTSTGWCVLDDARLVSGTIQPHAKLRGPERLEWLEKQLKGILKEHLTDPKEVVMCLEDAVVSKNGQVTIGLAQWQGVARLMLYKMGFGFYVCAPTALKKYVTGSGAAKKEQMLLAMFKNFKLDFQDNNEADAAGLALIARATEQVKTDEKLISQARREVLNRLEKVSAKNILAKLRL